MIRSKICVLQLYLLLLTISREFDTTSNNIPIEDETKSHAPTLEMYITMDFLSFPF